MISLYEYQRVNKLLLAAHRGSSGKLTENTLAAFADAIDAGIGIIELDIQITADNKIVVYHDFNPPGFQKRISEINYHEIKTLVVGEKSDSGYDSMHIPLLDDVLKIVAGKCYLMIEIKVNTGNKFLENINKLLDLIIKYNYLENTIFGSFSLDAISNLKQINPDVYTAAIKIPNDRRLPSELRDIVGCEAFICDVEELNQEVCDDAKKHNIFLGVYNVDDEEALNKALKYEARAVATNHPEKIVQLVKDKKIYQF